MRRLLPVFFVLASALVSACTVAPVSSVPSGRNDPFSGGGESRAARQFTEVVHRVEPVAESQCRNFTRGGANCDFLIVVDDRPDETPNAFQTRDSQGRPVLAFNLALIREAQNADELAFVMGHEASHHILGHLDRVQEDAAIGAIIFSGIAAMTGADEASVRSAEEFGASVGARTFTKNYELEADELGTVISLRSGFDPIRGARFFERLPDPGNRFLGTHPPNSERIETVRRTSEAYRAGGGV
ncbi:M48 family metallopeptidase [Alloyangia pacifica]|uniref:M48 family metallopeptidase n=1 Tax=Alloyangia pacifica TaxID=311180 RepID=UPI0031CDF097